MLATIKQLNVYSAISSPKSILPNVIIFRNSSGCVVISTFWLIQFYLSLLPLLLLLLLLLVLLLLLLFILLLS